MRTVNDLIEALQDLVNSNEEAGELPLRVAIQPNYPIHLRLGSVRVGVAKGCEGRPDKPVLYFVAGESSPYDENPYASCELWDEGNGLADDYDRVVNDGDVDWDELVEDIMSQFELDPSWSIVKTSSEDGRFRVILSNMFGNTIRTFYADPESGNITEDSRLD